MKLRHPNDFENDKTIQELVMRPIETIRDHFNLIKILKTNFIELWQQIDQ